MSTKFPAIFQALAAPFDPAEVKTRAGERGRKLSYITARTAMNRLDEVLGSENWWDAYIPSPVANQQGVLCRLTIRLPDGQTVTKEGIGGVTTMHDPSDTDKTGESDALKRSAVKFGVGRYLYQDGVPSFDAELAPRPLQVVQAEPPAEPPQQAEPADLVQLPQAGRPPEPPAKPPRPGSYQDWLTHRAAEAGVKQFWELHNYLIKLLKDANYEFGCDTEDRRAVYRVMAQMYDDGQATAWLADAVERFKAHKKGG